MTIDMIGTLSVDYVVASYSVCQDEVALIKRSVQNFWFPVHAW